MFSNKNVLSRATLVIGIWGGMALFNASHAANYSYKVPFEGDFVSAHEEAFAEMVYGLSNGSTDPSSVKVNLDDIIQSENITPDGQLEVVFSEAAVKQMLGSGKITVWNGLKDPMILWLTRGTMVDVVGEGGKVDERTEARIVVSGERDGFVDAFVGRGSENKVNTILPLNDLDDMEKINISDVMSGDPGRIAGASSRYTQGIAVAGLLTSGNSGLQFTYHIVDVSTAKKLFSGTVEGGINNITTKFYEDLRTAMGNQKTSGNSGESRAVNNVTTHLEGFGIQDQNNLGVQANGSWQIMIKGTPSFDSMMEIKNNFHKIGFRQADIVDMKGGDVIFNLTTMDGVNPSNLMEAYPALVPDSNVASLYHFDASVNNVIVIPDDSKKKTGSATGTGTDSSTGSAGEENAGNKTGDSVSTDAGGNTGNNAGNIQNSDAQNNKAEQRTRPTERSRRKNNSGMYPDPNKRYHTGGGV